MGVKMTIEVVRSFLGWCTVINIGMVILWILFIAFAHDWVYRWHTKWLKMSVEQFDAIHYKAILFYRIAILVFNLVPYLALCIIDFS